MKKKLQIIFYILMIISLLLSFAQRMNLLDSAYADVELQSCTPLTSSGLNFRTFSNLKVKDIKLENYDSEKIRDTIYNVLKDNIVFQNYHTSDENISKKDFWSNVDFIVTYEDNYLNIYIQDYKRNSNTFCVGAPSIPGITYFAAYNRSYYSFVLGFPYEYYLRVRPNDLFVEKFDVSSKSLQK